MLSKLVCVVKYSVTTASLSKSCVSLNYVLHQFNFIIFMMITEITTPSLKDFSN